MTSAMPLPLPVTVSGIAPLVTGGERLCSTSMFLGGPQGPQGTGPFWSLVITKALGKLSLYIYMYMLTPPKPTTENTVNTSQNQKRVGFFLGGYHIYIYIPNVEIVETFCWTIDLWERPLQTYIIDFKRNIYLIVPIGTPISAHSAFDHCFLGGAVALLATHPGLYPPVKHGLLDTPPFIIYGLQMIFPARSLYLQRISQRLNTEG